jgi:DNA-binding NarL/FixJ family response regulator
MQVAYLASCPEAAEDLQEQTHRISHKEITILVADDHAMVRRSLCDLLETQPGWKTLEASNGNEAVSISQGNPDIVIIDIDMPELNGLDAASEIHKQHPAIPILLLSAYSAEQMIQRAIRVGVRGYVLKTDTTKNLIAAVNALLKGREFFSTEISRRFSGELFGIGLRSPHLTAREIEVVQLLGNGNSNKQVAYALGISTRTVEKHRAHIMQKFGFRSFSELLRYAIRNSIVQP